MNDNFSPPLSTSKIKELLERAQSNIPKYVRQRNTFDKVSSTAQEANALTLHNE